ncbi:MAG: hypothetical protein FWG27_00380 [Treponema sp.]|nr:hypothetical protein [Treponema sp.]
MKKILTLMVFICLGSEIFAQDGFLGLSLGFQYGTAQVFDNGETLRKITEPGAIFTLRMLTGPIGFFGRIGLLFPSSVTEGDLTLTYSSYDYILFINGAFGASFDIPLNDRFAFIIDTGMSINDLTYGGSYRDIIDATWKVKIENMGQPIYFSGGQRIENVKMKETYNDIALGIIGNVAMRFNFTRNAYLELGAAASFDFLRLRTYKFAADFRHLNDLERETIVANIPGVKTEEKEISPGNFHVLATELVLESDSRFNAFKQFTFMPSICIGWRF